MPQSKRKRLGAAKRKARARTAEMQPASKAVIPAKPEAAQMAQPRPRIRLRSAMRAAGLDEWKVAWTLNTKIDELSVSKKSSDKKLLLDYLKEAARHLDPAVAAAAAAAQEAATVEVVHQVPRPDRSIAES